MRKSSKLLGALAVAGLVAAGGSAFTGTGLSSAAGPTKFVGGTVSQSITGATLNSIVYTYSDVSNTSVISFLLTFADATGAKTPTVIVTAPTAVVYTCTAIAAGTFLSTCTAATPNAGVSNVAITVPSV